MYNSVGLAPAVWLTSRPGKDAPCSGLRHTMINQWIRHDMSDNNLNNTRNTKPLMTRFKHRLQTTVLFLTAMLSVDAVYADVLIMKNGDQITGQVLKQAQQVLEFKTPYAGTIKVNWDEVSQLQTVKPVRIMLDDKQIVSTRAIRNEADSTIIETETGTTPVIVKRKTLAYINPESWRIDGGYKTSGKVNVALDFERGNTDTDEIDLDAELTIRRAHDRVRLFADLEKDSSSSVTTKDKWLTTGKYDYFVSERHYYYGSLYFESDELADLNLRSGLGGGIGYLFYKRKKLNLSGELGLSWAREDFENEDLNEFGAMNWAIDFDKFVFTDFTQFYHKHLGVLSLEDTEDVIVKSWTGLRFLLPHGFSASLEANVDFDNTPAAGKDRIDNRYSIKLGYGW